MARARAYVLGRIPEDQQFRGQAKLIVVQLGKEAAQAKTVKEIADAIEKDLETRQDPIRVVSFYMSTWKKKGWVRQLEVERDETEASAANTAEAAPHNADDDGTGATPQERVEAMTEVDVTMAHEAASEPVKTGPPDFTGMKLSDAVLVVLEKTVNGQHTAETVAEYLSSNGYEVRPKQVQSALGNLVQKRTVVKSEDGHYARA